MEESSCRMGRRWKDEEEEEEEERWWVHVSPGALVWVRRPNGSWWPGRVLSPLDLLDGCPAPPRTPCTPIMLLGLHHGTNTIDWYNLERSKRVKPFRCGEHDECIKKAKARAARQRRRSYSERKYARREDAILRALEIEKSHLRDEAKNRRQGGRCSGKSKMGNGVGRRSSCAAGREHCDVPSSRARHASSLSKRKRQPPNDSEDDVLGGFRRMRDLKEIGSKKVPKQKGNAGAVLELNGEPSTSQVKRGKQSHTSAKRKRSCAKQAYESSRKKDRLRPLSELCDDNMGYTCSDSSSSASSVETLLDTLKTNQAKGTENSCMNGIHGDDCSQGDDLCDVPLPEAGHLQTCGSHASTKGQISTHKRQSTDCSKVGTPCKCDRRNSGKKIIGSVDQDGNYRDRNASDCEYCKKGVVKYQEPSDETAFSDERMDNSHFSKPTELDNDMQLAIDSADLDCVGAVEQQCSESKPEHDELSETISNQSNCEKGAVSSLPFMLPLGELPPQQKAPDPTRCHAAKPIKSVQLNSTLYDVELSVQGSNRGPHVPIVSLMSKWNHKHILGYPVTVEILNDVYCHPALSRGDHHPATSSLNRILKSSEAADLRCQRSSSYSARSKHSRCGKISEHKMDKTWRPHTKNLASSPRKMRRLSSFGISHRDCVDREFLVEKIAGPTITCIPLRLVFMRINEALSPPVRPGNPK